MSIKGIYATEWQKFQPDQFVNIWQMSCENKLNFYCEGKSSDIGEILSDKDLEDFVLEPVDEEGNVMPLAQAIALGNAPDGWRKIESGFDGQLPLYWKNEVSGRLEPIVIKYINQEGLEEIEINVLKSYLAQWVNASSFQLSDEIVNLRSSVNAIANVKNIDVWLDQALAIGIDPL